MSTALLSTPSETAFAFTWESEPKQGRVLTDYAQVFELLYGGAAGPGKSEYLLVYNILRRLKYPGTGGLFLRREYQMLIKSDGAIPRSHAILHGSGAAWNGSERKWTFPGGGALEFGHIHSEEDKHNYQSAAYADIQFDELTQFTETQYLYLFSRARTKIPDCATTIRAASNPGGVGHGWVKTRFIDSMPPETVRYFKRLGGEDVEASPDDPLAKSRVFVPGRLEDNRYLTQTRDYEATLLAMPEDDMRALLYGDWDAWKGSVFKRWQRDRHTLRPQALPPNWTRRVGMDWGTARPFVALWGAWGTRLPDEPRADTPCDGEHVYIYREVSQRGLRDEDMARAVALYSQDERVTEVRADPNSFFLDNNQTGYSPAALFRGAPYNLPLVRANNQRVIGKRKVDEMLGQCACGTPRLRVFDTCRELIRTLPSLPYSKTQVEDVDTDAEDDQYDALRYLLMGPPREATPQTIHFDTGQGPQQPRRLR